MIIYARLQHSAVELAAALCCVLQVRDSTGTPTQIDYKGL